MALGSLRLFILSAAMAAPAFFLMPAVARAADTPNDESDNGAIAEVIVTATRREERLLDVPVSASALSGVPLEALGSSGQDIRQLAFSVPSLNIESSNGRTFPRFYIRGYGNTGRSIVSRRNLSPKNYQLSWATITEEIV